MRKALTLAAVAVLTLLLSTMSYAGGPWEVKIEGNGMVDPFTSSGEVEVCGTDLGWNFKMNYDGQVNGQLNIVEKLCDGSIRHFKLAGYQVYDVGDPSSRPILFNCAAGTDDARSVRVEGWNDDGLCVSAHWRDSQHATMPNTVWYWVQDSGGNFITNTNARLPVSNPFTMVCSAAQ
jgi:hypothetical protein